jgi:hypothetical protein
MPAAVTWPIARNAMMRTKAWFVSDICPRQISVVCILACCPQLQFLLLAKIAQLLSP